MPLVGNDLCPIAIDVIEQPELLEEAHEDIAEAASDYDSPLHYIDHKEQGFEDTLVEEELNEIIDQMDLTEDEKRQIMEKGDQHVDYDKLLAEAEGNNEKEIEEDEEEDHFIPTKGEHNLDDDHYVDAEHLIPQKDEFHDVHHLPKDKWKAEYHGEEVKKEPVKEKPKEKASANLKPKEPEADDPRLNIPQGKSTAPHDHLIVDKEPVEDPEFAPKYGEAYELDQKEAKRGSKESAGLQPKLPIGELAFVATEKPKKTTRKPCSAYGETNRCEGMSCKADSDCASQCCG